MSTPTPLTAHHERHRETRPDKASAVITLTSGSRVYVTETNADIWNRLHTRPTPGFLALVKANVDGSTAPLIVAVTHILTIHAINPGATR